MTGYTKLFGSIVASTIWREDDKTRLVWITMLAIANKHGEVEASVPGLADLSRVTVDEARASIAKLEAPDLDSRSTEEDGRRIVKVEGGWRLVNHAKYRKKLSADERREYLAQKQRECRARQQASTSVNNGQPPSTLSTSSTQAEADPKAEAFQPQDPSPAFSKPAGDVLLLDSEKTEPTDPVWEPTEPQLRLGALFRRRASTRWSKAELKAYRAILPIDEEDVEHLERYYNGKHPPSADFRRHDLATLLNNFTGEVDRARNWKPQNCF